MRMGANSSPQEDAEALAGENATAKGILYDILITQDRIGRRDRGIMTIMLLDKIECYEQAIVDLYEECGGVFEVFYFELAKRSGTPEYLIP